MAATLVRIKSYGGPNRELLIDPSLSLLGGGIASNDNSRLGRHHHRLIRHLEDIQEIDKLRFGRMRDEQQGQPDQNPRGLHKTLHLEIG